ncbi:uncharacterized protein LOC134853958 [Symsagittifera roscoffensis]|uniref:uncharacterized protein LOC134853958 n=1 Tax=Symsagittifera roscoffensis TaxID=84072 RepID=UPI00307C00D2
MRLPADNGNQFTLAYKSGETPAPVVNKQPPPQQRSYNGAPPPLMGLGGAGGYQQMHLRKIEDRFRPLKHLESMMSPLTYRNSRSQSLSTISADKSFAKRTYCTTNLVEQRNIEAKRGGEKKNSLGGAAGASERRLIGPNGEGDSLSLSSGLTPKPMSPQAKNKKASLSSTGYYPSDLQNGHGVVYTGGSKTPKGTAALDRDKTYFPFGKPGSGAPITDSNTGKVKTLLNGKFRQDYYCLDNKDQQSNVKRRRELLDEQRRDISQAEWKRREMAREMRNAPGSSVDLVEKIRSFNERYPPAPTSRGSSDITRKHFDIRYADPQTSRLYSEELDRQFLQKQFERFEREVKTHRDEREHEHAMNSYFWKPDGHGAPSPYRPAGNRRMNLGQSLYPNPNGSTYQKIFHPIRKSNSETNVSKPLASPRENNLFWWMDTPPTVDYKLTAPFATSSETF